MEPEEDGGPLHWADHWLYLNNLPDTFILDSKHPKALEWVRRFAVREGRALTTEKCHLPHKKRSGASGKAKLERQHEEREDAIALIKHRQDLLQSVQEKLAFIDGHPFLGGLYPARYVSLLSLDADGPKLTGLNSLKYITVITGTSSDYAILVFPSPK